MIGLLAGCQTGPFAASGSGGGDATRAAPVSDTVQLIERDVEAPEVFQAEEAALWDGRPSLGGVWVAAPGVTDPERVIIRNTANGKFVIGALFKRERDNPGPSLQLSSDAAAALGILAGSPTEIDVVALRREEVEDATAAPAAGAPQPVAQFEAAPLAEEIVETPVAADTPTDPIAAASAAIDAAEAEEDSAETFEGDAIAASPADAFETRPEVARPRRQNFLARIFGRRTPAAPAVEPATLTDTDSFAGEPPVASAAAPSITATSLDAGPVRTASAAPAGASAPARRYVQIGIFSVEQNARDTATSLSTAGIAPTVLEQESRGRKFWRVVVGPSGDADDQAAVIRKAKSLGFNDAFATDG